MSFIDACLTIALDSKRIAAIRGLSVAGRLTVWWNYLRLRSRRLAAAGRGTIALFGRRVSYPDLDNLLHLFREIHVRRLYALQLGRPAPVIIDCGSNIGISVLFFKDLYPDARVMGFEPNPDTFAVLADNVTGNQLGDVTVHQLALTDAPGTIELFVNPDEPGALNHGLFQGTQLTAAASVRAERLSSFIEGEVDLLKLDVEGAEELVISELAEQGKLRLIRNIACEYHHHHHRDADADRLSVLLSILEQHGFGYQLDAVAEREPLTSYQDLMIYAYRKDDPSEMDSISDGHAEAASSPR